LDSRSAVTPLKTLTISVGESNGWVEMNRCKWSGITSNAKTSKPLVAAIVCIWSSRNCLTSGFSRIDFLYFGHQTRGS
jgi:hypothetical protein